MMKFQRWQETNIKKALETNRVVILAGARQCGKTTIANQLASSNNDIIFRSLDDIAMLMAAKADPHGFVHHNKQTLIIDEIQRAPELLIAIKKEVDDNPAYGRFLITGSADIQNLPTVSESLAGRVRKIVLHTLSQGEIIGSNPNFIEKAFQQKFDCKGITKQDVLKLAIKGGFPESVLHGNIEDSFNWCNDYVDSLIEHDLKNISNIKRHDTLKELVKVLSAWSSKLMDKTHIMSCLSVTKPTFDSYISVLRNMFLVDTVPSWIKTDYEYISKKSKMFMSDTGLMSGVLGWSLDQVEFDHDKCGKLIETFVYNQLVAEIDTLGSNFSIFHYRDSEKREIDFIIQNRNNDVLAIEVKSGSSVSGDSFKHIKWFKENISKESNNFVGLVLYTGENIAKFGDNLWAIPMDALWGTDRVDTVFHVKRKKPILDQISDYVLAYQGYREDLCVNGPVLTNEQNPTLGDVVDIRLEIF